jgi:hypothetical protein
MRRLVLLSTLALAAACGGNGEVTNSGDSSGDPANFATSDTVHSADGASDDLADGEDIPEPEVVEAPCELSTGMCPNACEHGASGQGESCVTDTDCGCGFCCGFGQCKSFDSVGCESFASLAGCLCPGEAGNDPVDPTNDIPWQVEPTSYMDDCAAKTPVGSGCNPFCQLGCPVGSHCALVDDERFTCVTSGAGVEGATCENSSTCSPWMSCFGTFDAPVDTCRIVCDSDVECPGGQACNLAIQFTGMGTISFCDVALLPCDIWTSNCPQGMKCVISAGQTICSESTWDGIEGYPCTDLGDCAYGLQCVGLSCVPICSTADQPPLSATPCSELCAAGWQIVDQNLQIGRCSTDDQQ